MKKLVASILSFALVVGLGDKSTYASTFEPVEFDYANSDINIMRTDKGEKGIFTLNNCNASKLFNFKFNLNPGESLVTARDYLGEEYDTGEVYIVDSNNVIKRIIEKPWAIDSTGKKIPTYFNVSGNILTQTVNHSCEDSFPITADPNAWQITMCIANISQALLGTLLPIGKILQIKKAIKIAGGLSVFAKLVIAIAMGAADKVAVAMAFGPLVIEAIMVLTGIDSVIKNCTW